MTLNGEDKQLLRTMLDRRMLVCAVCLYREDGRQAKGALTVIEGYAVCEDHLGYVAQGQRFHSILETVRREYPASGSEAVE